MLQLFACRRGELDTKEVPWYHKSKAVKTLPRPRGYLVLFGQSSGAVPPLDPQVLNAKGSLFLTRPTLAHYIATRDELLWRAGDLFRWIAAGELQVRVAATYKLSAAGEDQDYLAGRHAHGKVLLIP